MANDTSSVLVDSVFLAKLILSELYKEPVEGLADRLKERAPRGLTEEGLNAAAEHIIRTHASGSFPKYPACIAAIEQYHGRAGVPVSGGIMDAVTKANYADRAILFCKRAGHTPIILRREQDTESQWLTWQAYFEAIDMRGFAAHMNTASGTTIPANWPWEFDNFSPVGSAVQPIKPVYYKPRFDAAAE
jgi:hypothetical protein